VHRPNPYLVSVLLLLVACGSTPAPAPAPGPAPAPAAAPLAPSPGRASGPLTRFEVYTALIAQASLPLSRGEHCSDVVGVELRREATLGDWIAYNLHVLDEADDEGAITLPVECHAAEGHAGEWECTTEFRAGQGGESPWNWGIRARFRDTDAALVEGSLLCTGSG
jgi:hypothetical protein